MDFKVAGISLYYIISWFFIYSFLGWVWESCYVSAKRRQWVNRGFLHGPMLPIYGTGAVIILLATIPVRDSLWLVFLLGMLAASIVYWAGSFIFLDTNPFADRKSVV